MELKLPQPFKKLGLQTQAALPGFSFYILASLVLSGLNKVLRIYFSLSANHLSINLLIQF